MDRDAKLRRLRELRAEADALETELARASATQAAGAAPWPPRPYYGTYQALAGFVLGMVAALISLLFNVVGSLAAGLHPLQLIRVYLTFPLGAAALTTNQALVLAMGCCLYLATGAAIGIPFYLLLTAWFGKASAALRFVAATVLALGLWAFNFYAVLSWLQPLLFDGRWILEEIPWWVSAATHLVFGWTIWLLQSWGEFVPYRHPAEAP